jgi:hypothetical protein
METYGWEQRRRLEATLGVLAEVAATPAHEDEPVIAIRSFGTGRSALALSEVRRCEPGLARLLDRVRSRRLAEGCRVELRNPSEALGVGLDRATLPQAFTVYDAVRRRIPGRRGDLRPPAGVHLCPEAGGWRGWSPGDDASVAPSSAASRVE